MDAKATAAVDQTTNAVTFTLDNAASYPVWLLPSGKKTTYSTVNGQTVIFSVAGDYKIPYRIGNRNGISAGTDTLSFHIDNSEGRRSRARARSGASPTRSPGISVADRWALRAPAGIVRSPTRRPPWGSTTTA